MSSTRTPDAFNLSPESLGGTSVRLSLIVDDADESLAQAIAAGGKEVLHVADRPYGLRQGRVVDPSGHHWLIRNARRLAAPGHRCNSGTIAAHSGTTASRSSTSSPSSGDAVEGLSIGHSASWRHGFSARQGFAHAYTSPRPHSRPHPSSASGAVNPGSAASWCARCLVTPRSSAISTTAGTCRTRAQVTGAISARVRQRQRRCGVGDVTGRIQVAGFQEALIEWGHFLSLVPPMLRQTTGMATTSVGHEEAIARASHRAATRLR